METINEEKKYIVTTYKASDGKIFKDKYECQLYEDRLMEESMPLTRRYQVVREMFTDSYKHNCLSDDYLLTNNRGAPRNSILTQPAKELEYGIVYLRDDAVNVLLAYIDRLLLCMKNSSQK